MERLTKNKRKMIEVLYEVAPDDGLGRFVRQTEGKQFRLSGFDHAQHRPGSAVSMTWPTVRGRPRTRVGDCELQYRGDQHDSCGRVLSAFAVACYVCQHMFNMFSNMTDMRPFSKSLPMALLQARESAMRLFRPMLAEHDLSEQQWRVLRALTASEDPLEVSVLAEHTSLLAPSLSRILSNLEGRGLVARATAAHDQRRAIIALTAAGGALVSAVAPRSEALYSKIEKEFGGDRLQRLLGELHDLAALEIEDAHTNREVAS